jgi:uncharacterized membrane protein YbaN (DUF454 family)
MYKSVQKYLLIVLGTLSLALGVVGIFLPVLPTTPFLLLASFCYLRSSDRLYQWLIHQRILGAHLYNYITYRAVLKRTKLVSLTVLWIGLMISALLIQNWYVRGFLLLVGIGVSIHLFALKTLEKSEMNKPAAGEDDEPME